MRVVLLLALALVACAIESSTEDVSSMQSSSSFLEDFDDGKDRKVPEGAAPVRRTNSYGSIRQQPSRPQLQQQQQRPQLRRTNSAPSLLQTRTGFEIPPPKTKIPPVSDLITRVNDLRAQFQGMEGGKTDEELVTATFNVFQQIYALDPPKILSMDQFVEAVKVEYNHTSTSSARGFIDAGKYRGFTTKKYDAYILNESANQSQHDGLHEVVHVASGVDTTIASWGADWQEVFTEYWTQIFRPLMNPPVPDFEAYHNPKEFGRDLAKWIGVGPMHRAFLQNQGMDVIIKAIAAKKCVAPRIAVPPKTPAVAYNDRTNTERETIVADILRTIVWSDPKTQGKTSWNAKPMMWLNQCAGGTYFKTVNWRLESRMVTQGVYENFWARF
jgi:hypothetical protein